MAKPSSEMDSVRRGKEVLADLLADKEKLSGSAIHEKIQTLVSIGDPIVPDIVAILDSGVERRYVEGKPRRQHVKGYAGMRMGLIEALRGIGTPAARQALLEMIAKSKSLADYRDLVAPCMSMKDPAYVNGISALVPRMLRRLGEVGIAEEDCEAQELATDLAGWSRKWKLLSAVGPMEELLLKVGAVPEYARGPYGAVFSALVELAPERAASVALALLKRESMQENVLAFSRDCEYSVTRVALARYFSLVLSREDLGADVRAGMYRAMPSEGLHNINDPTKWVEDTECFMKFLEGRLAWESDDELRGVIQEKLKSFRRDLQEERE